MGGVPTGEAAQALWTLLARSPAGVTAVTAAAKAGVSEPYARSRLRRWADAGLVARDGSIFRPVKTMTERPPIVSTDGRVQPHGEMTADEFRAIWDRSRVSAASLSRLLRLTDESGRAANNMAIGERKVDHRTGEAMRLIAKVIDL